MNHLVVINIVGLTPDLLGPHTPHLNRLIEDGFMCPLNGVFPAVTCTAQASMLTGTMPTEHGIVGNGWYFRDLAEVGFWKQSNHLVQGEKVWDALYPQYPDFICSKLFWWYNMYANVNYSVTPRPMYPADGRKVLDIYSHPSDLQATLKQKLGEFPFFNFWGPMSGLASSQWIAQCAMEEFKMHRPNLQLVYLPHLDYNLQRLGPNAPQIQQDVTAIDRVAGELIEFARAEGAAVMVVSEYGIMPVDQPVLINRVLREHGYIEVRETLGWELLDCGASRAFAVADHQCAHVYVRDPKDQAAVKQLLEKTDGIDRVLDDAGKQEWGLNHDRAGDLVAVSTPNAWFVYYYWLDETKAPDFATTVDIHRKPGYDPVELFMDPDHPALKLKVIGRLIQKKLGFRMLMDVIPLKPELVKGSHGRHAMTPETGPLFICSDRSLQADHYEMTDIKACVLRYFQQ